MSSTREPADRYWLLTWTTYGAWLPGDRRGSASPRRSTHNRWLLLNTPALPSPTGLPPLERWAGRRMPEPPVLLCASDAPLLFAQFRETARFRGWTLFACAVMRNHVHLVVGVPGDPDPARLLLAFKVYASRALNRARGRRRRWWTQSGSRRRLRAEANVVAAVEYVRQQAFPLFVWVSDGFPELWRGTSPETVG